MKNDYFVVCSVSSKEFYIFHLYRRFQNTVCMYTYICIHITYIHICNCKQIKDSGSVIILKQLHAHIFYRVDINVFIENRGCDCTTVVTRSIENLRFRWRLSSTLYHLHSNLLYRGSLICDMLYVNALTTNGVSLV